MVVTSECSCERNHTRVYGLVGMPLSLYELSNGRPVTVKTPKRELGQSVPPCPRRCKKSTISDKIWNLRSHPCYIRMNMTISAVLGQLLGIGLR